MRFRGRTGSGRERRNFPVIPAKAGIHIGISTAADGWTPAFAGVTAGVPDSYEFPGPEEWYPTTPPKA